MRVLFTPHIEHYSARAGEAALTFKPQDPSVLAEKLLSLAYDVELYEKLSKKSLERARRFAWEKAAREYLEVYKEIA
jgi:glycosyltransferase involved in cell wall biosynthesis